MVRSAENEVQLCMKVLSEYRCIICLPFKPVHFHYKKKITKYSKDHMKQAVSQATVLIKLDFLLICVYMLLLQQSQLSQIISHLTMPLSFNLSYIQKPPQNPRFTQYSQTLLPVFSLIRHSKPHQLFLHTSQAQNHFQEGHEGQPWKLLCVRLTSVHGKIMEKITRRGC